VLKGSMAGVIVPLPPKRYRIGSNSGLELQIPAAGVLPFHAELMVGSSIHISSLGGQVLVNGVANRFGQLNSGDVVEVGSLQLQFVDSQILATARSVWISKFKLNWLPSWVALPFGLAVLAVFLLWILELTGNPRLVPIAMITAAAVVPVGVLSFVHAWFKYQAASLRSILITTGLGATLGIVATLFLGFFTGIGGLFAAPMVEEPAKLLATFFCWHRSSYRSPVSGLVLGLAAGAGFALAETAGYFFEYLTVEGFTFGVKVLLLRSVLSPFGHVVWTAAAASAWFQVGWGFHGSWKKIFLRAILIAIGLHALWNSHFFGFISILLSSALSFIIFIRLMKTAGTWRAQWAFLP